jgi:crotonobetainyl-CoA:carnitine CoA-transferase CaiB-like acyl-CoA transferase
MASSAPLEGCRVLELSGSSAAVSGRILADLGADVVKVEPPGGEPARSRPPLAECTAGDPISLFWLAFNVGKRSIVVDLECERGLNEFVALARNADIVITDFERFDIATNDKLAALARAANPMLVWTEIWPYGRGGAHETYPAGDLVLQAMGGHLYLNGDVDRPPVRIGLPVALCQGGAEAASAALMAYYHRIKTGQGQRVDISIQECISWTMLNTTMTTQLLGIEEMRGGAVKKERSNKYFTRLVWKCRDGYIHFGPVGGGGGAARQKSYAGLLRWMAEDGIDDPILTARDWNGKDLFTITQEDYDALSEPIGRFLATKPVMELMDRAVKERILLAPVSSIPQVMDNPHLRARGLYTSIADAQRGTILEYPTAWVSMTATPLRLPAAAPLIDADGDALRAQLMGNLEDAA